MRFSRPLTDVLCKRPFPEFVAKIRIQRQRSSADIYRSCEQDCNRPAAFKNATVRERPLAACRALKKRTFADFAERPTAVIPMKSLIGPLKFPDQRTGALCYACA